MSLISLLKQPTIKEKFRQNFEVPKVTTTKALRAPSRSNHYALVGTAFDYLLRFYLQRLNKNAMHWPWTAEQGLRQLESEEGWGYDIVTGEEYTPDDSPIVAHARAVFRQAQDTHKQYLSTGKLTDQLIESTIHLAQLDSVYRRPYDDDDLEALGTVYEEDIEDLTNLIALVKPKLFRARSMCLLNPSFGKASELVGGADADLLVDDTLIDIKTVKDCFLKADYYYQLLGYFILHKLSAIGNLKPKPEINKIGIYFSRHGHLEIFDLPDVSKAFVKWFTESASL